MTEKVNAEVPRVRGAKKHTRTRRQGPKSKRHLNKLKQLESPNTTAASEEFPVVLKRARGTKVIDVDGQKFTDLTACFGVLAMGHRPATTIQAIRKQSANLIHGMGDVFPSEAKVRMLETLASVTPYKNPKVILSTAGGDAVESAIKTALLATGKKRFLVFEGGYHGLQMGALQLTTREDFKAQFKGWDSGNVTICPFPLSCDANRVAGTAPTKEELAEEQNTTSEKAALEFVKAELKKGDVAALITEPLQGRAGEREFPTGFLAKVHALCQANKALLIFDEIYTGFGRTGTMFACEHEGVVPDLLCVGKALGGGLPISACVGEVIGKWPESTGEAIHTSTFLGHPLACATAKATVKEISKRLPEWQSTLPEWNEELKQFKQRITKRKLHPSLSFELRGRGWMQGFWFFRAKPGFAAELMFDFLKAGFITLPSGPKGRVMSLTPPLNTPLSDLRKFLREFEGLLQKKSDELPPK